MATISADILNSYASPPYYEISIKDLNDEMSYFCSLYPNYEVTNLLKIIRKVNTQQYLINGWHILYTTRGFRLGIPWS